MPDGARAVLRDVVPPEERSDDLPRGLGHGVWGTAPGKQHSIPAADPLSGSLFVFFNRRFNRVKVLVWTPGGWRLVYVERVLSEQGKDEALAVVRGMLRHTR